MPLALPPLHPAVVLGAFAVLAAGATFGALPGLGMSVGIGLSLILAGWSRPDRRSLGALNRLRWLMLSLLVLYAWFSPGTILWAPLGSWSPTREGLGEAFYRLAVLVVAIGGMNMLARRYTSEQLLTGLYVLSAPLALVGLNRMRLASRLWLVMSLAPRVVEALGPAQGLAGAQRIRRASPPTSRLQRALDAAAGLVTQRLEQVGRLVAASAPEQIELERAPVAAWQWLVPAGFAAAHALLFAVTQARLPL